AGSFDSTTFATGSLQPVGLLSQFDGESMLGEWVLHIEDIAAGGALGVASFALEITPQVTPILEPHVYALVGVGPGLVGMRMCRRRRGGFQPERTVTNSSCKARDPPRQERASG